ncbi:40S ribosomal protein S5-1 [Hordeum vulgare]|nr:40S ribosomal protein S5-1 [Hordeum vulgare]
MSDGMLHIHDVEGPKKTGSVETRLEAMEQQVFKCQGMVERGLNANHTMITEFTSNHKMDAIDIGKHLSRLYDTVDQLQGQIYDLQNQNCEYEYIFKSIRRMQPVEGALGPGAERQKLSLQLVVDTSVEGLEVMRCWTWVHLGPQMLEVVVSEALGEVPPA